VLSERARPFSINRCTDVDLDSATANLVPSAVEAAVSAANSDPIIRAQGDAVIGVDGAFSAVRQSMQKEIAGFEYDESYLAHGYRELTIPPAPDGSWRMAKEALHIWPRKSFHDDCPSEPGWLLHLHALLGIRRSPQLRHDKTNDEIRRFFDEEFSDAVPLMPSLLDDFKTNPTGLLVTIRCARGFTKTRSPLSATPPTPSYRSMARE